MIKKLLFAAAIFAAIISTFATTVFADYYSSGITLYKSMKGEEVFNLQNDLRSLGYFNYGPTGYFGSATEQSVIAFQRDNNLAADGIVGRATAREIKVDKVILQGEQYLGVPYVWGGMSPSGFDCSGFTHYVFLKNGITLPRTSALLYEAGKWVPRSDLKPGDLVFFSTYKPGPSHVGIYIGNSQFIHASSGANKVTISDINKTYYAQRYVGARRVIQ
ncbi:MAG: NlpC/P60 family protein [Clostridia bacterium]|nr:NlpC/P60 family protein [Clostridia bacterium]